MLKPLISDGRSVQVRRSARASAAQQELGRLLHGRYEFELRAESINCDVVSMTVELDCDSNGRLVLNTVT